MRLIPARVIAGMLSCLIAAGATSSSAQTTSPGKQAVFVSASNIPLTGGNSVVLSGAIDGLVNKKGRVLRVTATVVNSSTSTGGYFSTFFARVNGITLSGHHVGSDVPAAGTFVTDNGTWWLDLDANPTLQ